MDNFLRGKGGSGTLSNLHEVTLNGGLQIQSQIFHTYVGKLLLDKVRPISFLQDLTEPLV